ASAGAGARARTPRGWRASSARRRRRRRCSRTRSGRAHSPHAPPTPPARSATPRRRSRWRSGPACPRTSSFRQLDEQLAAVLAAEQADERARCVLEPLDDVLAVEKAALGEPARQACKGGAVQVSEVADEEPLHPDAAGDHEGDAPRAARRRHLVVLRDLATD